MVGKIGIYSDRKFAVTWRAAAGARKDGVGIRGRCKSIACQQDAYADTTIPYINVKVVTALCHGKPIAYLMKEELGVTKELLHKVAFFLGGPLFVTDSIHATWSSKYTFRLFTLT